LGPPHVVCVLPTLDVLNQAPLAHLGPIVRYHNWYAPSGCNFNIVARLSENCVQLRTYERGVEEETLGCGTGAAASVWVLHHQLGWVLPETTVMTKSGEPIDIDVRDPLRPLLTGRAHAIGHGCLDDGWLARHHLIPNDEKTF
jgi:diaminopimelate epimerase